MKREEIINEANNWNNDNIPLVTREIERLCRRAFMAGYNAAMNEADAHPTHWMPLPKAPALSNSENTGKKGSDK